MKPLKGYSLFVLELLIAHGPLVQRGGAWFRADGQGGAVRDIAVAALASRGLITIGVTGYGRTASVSPTGILWRSRTRERLYRQRKGKPWPQDTTQLPG
ncbi:hypothetical protein V5F49_11105 [Xanthobacter sp. V3C-3]|uniref:hypothetical protein n=1 Tax=Xanthobacter lutulentifluminis TaxID=3119935 RepID=UPI0037294BC0